MPLKRKSSKGASSSTAVNYDASRFYNERAEEQYGKIFNRSIIKERGFDLSHPDTQIEHILEARQWEEFGRQPQDAVISLVREFYANLKVRHDRLVVFVRGKEVAFDARTINTVYGFPEIMHDEYEEYKNGNVDYDNILHTICTQGAEWRMRDNVHLSLAKSDLREMAKYWYSFITARIKPTEHTTTVIKERAILIFCIMTGKTIDLGRLLQNSIYDYACGNSPSGLLHPSLITVLCQHVGVTWAPNEEVLKPKNPIVIAQAFMGARNDQGAARRARREFNQRAAERRDQAQAQEQPQQHRRSRMTMLEEEMHQQRQDMNAFMYRTDTFMNFMMDFTSVLAEQFPSASTSSRPYPPHPQWPPAYPPPEFQPPHHDDDDEDDGNDH
ncbi:uncharacterized protein [Primulina eburnea]|uniref:uncharacterized protein n=1 Tax=Primulina eburnea TaxID=1245227 RepID=UPI003C6CBE5C